MDRIATDSVAFYREQVQRLIHEYGQYKPSFGEVEMEVICDPVRDHYELMTVGWNGQRRIHGCVLHVDIRGGKIWIQHDGTEDGIADRLVEAGVPKQDIVLGFHSPFKRQFTEFGQG